MDEAFKEDGNHLLRRLFVEEKLSEKEVKILLTDILLASADTVRILK